MYSKRFEEIPFDKWINTIMLPQQRDVCLSSVYRCVCCGILALYVVGTLTVGFLGMLEALTNIYKDK